MFLAGKQYVIRPYEELKTLGRHVNHEGGVDAPRGHHTYFNFVMCELIGIKISTTHEVSTVTIRGTSGRHWDVAPWMCREATSKKLLALKAIKILKD